MSQQDINWFVGDDFEGNESKYDYYRSQYKRFRTCVERVLLVSYGTTGIWTTHPRDNLCSLLSKKLSVTARSLYLLAPSPLTKAFFAQHLDFTSCATIARALVSNFAMLYHFGIEECSEDEFRTRQLLMWWRDYRVRRKMNFDENFRDQADKLHEPDLKQRLSENRYWMSLPEKFRNHTLRHNHLLHSEEEILERAGADKAMHLKMYAYWSAHAHCDSVSFINMNEQRRGSGQVNVADIAMLGTTMEWVSGFLEFAAEKVDVIFAGAEERASKVKHLDLLRNKVVPMPWAGKLKLDEARQNFASSAEKEA